MYAQYEADRQKAIAYFKVTLDSESPSCDVRYVEAEAKTGTRYVVIASRMPGYANVKEGGAVLVTVLWPRQDAWVVSDSGHLDENYVREHLMGDQSVVHGGDLAALTMTIRRALGRE